MKRFYTIIQLNLIIFLFIATTSYAAPPVPMGIVTGSTKGTYYQFEFNIAELVKTKYRQLKVAPPRGSVENIYAVFNFQPDR